MKTIYNALNAHNLKIGDIKSFHVNFNRVYDTLELLAFPRTGKFTTIVVLNGYEYNTANSELLKSIAYQATECANKNKTNIIKMGYRINKNISTNKVIVNDSANNTKNASLVGTSDCWAFDVCVNSGGGEKLSFHLLHGTYDNVVIWAKQKGTKYEIIKSDEQQNFISYKIVEVLN